MNNPKVLFVAPRLHTNQFFLTKNLVEIGVKLQFLVIYKGGSENHKYVTPILSVPSRLIKWYTIGKNPKSAIDRGKLRKYHFSSFRECYSLYKGFNPDVVIVRNLRPLVSIQHFIIGLLLGKRVFLYTQNNYRQEIGIMRKLLYKGLGVLGVRHYTPVQGDAGAPRLPNTFYIPMVMDPLVEHDSILPKQHQKGIKILTVGKMMKRKNLKELVESLFRINFFEDPNNRLTIVAECITKENFGYLEEIKGCIPGHHDQIEFHLNITHDQVFELLKTTDLFVLPSHNEPAGNALTEAMACGLAVICSDSNGTQWYVKNGENGYVFSYSPEFEDLDTTLLKALDKEKLIVFGQRSLERIKKYHSIDNFYKNIILSSL